MKLITSLLSALPINCLVHGAAQSPNAIRNSDAHSRVRRSSSSGSSSGSSKPTVWPGSFTCGNTCYNGGKCKNSHGAKDCTGCKTSYSGHSTSYGDCNPAIVEQITTTGKYGGYSFTKQLKSPVFSQYPDMVVFYGTKRATGTWWEQQTSCNGDISMLGAATFNLAESKHLWNHINGPCGGDCKKEKYWLRAKADGKGQTPSNYYWYWSNENMCYTAWQYDNPNKFGNEDCLEVKAYESNRPAWNSQQCTDKRIISCEMRCSLSQCPAGYEIINGKCVDINECVIQLSPCGAQACRNTPGSFECYDPSCICNDGKGTTGDASTGDSCTTHVSRDDPISTNEVTTTHTLEICLHPSTEVEFDLNIDATAPAKTASHKPLFRLGWLAHSFLLKVLVRNAYDVFTVYHPSAETRTDLLKPFSPQFTPGNSYHFIIRIKDGMMAVFIDGLLVNIGSAKTPSGSFDINSPASLTIGSDGGVKGTLTNFKVKAPDGMNKCDECESGFRKNSCGICVDIDECAESIDTCAATDTCQNTRGGYTCIVEPCPSSPGSPEYDGGHGVTDVHYMQLDEGNRQIDFHGTCEYIMSQKCVDPEDKFGDNDLPWFRISGKNDIQYAHSYIPTWLTFIRMQFQLDANSPMVEIIKYVPGFDKPTYGTIKIGNGEPVLLTSPTYYPEARIKTTGYMNTQLKVHFDTPYEAGRQAPHQYAARITISEHRAFISLHCRYHHQVCGILGNYNGIAHDDWVDGKTGQTLPYPQENDFPRKPPSKELWDRTYEFGNSWLVPEIDTCDTDTNKDYPDDVCEASDEAAIKAICENFLYSPFSNCGINKNDLVEACEYDLCFVAKDAWHSAVCAIFDLYAGDCKEGGQDIGFWRDTKFNELDGSTFYCPFRCSLPEMMYSYASPACIPTIENCATFSFDECTGQTVEECSCPDDKPIWDKNTLSCTSGCGTDTECRIENEKFTCCPPGFYVNGRGNCNDIDECAASDNLCETGFKCENTVGSYTCADINECNDGSATCAVGEACINTDGSYTCTELCIFKCSDTTCPGGACDINCNGAEPGFYCDSERPAGHCCCEEGKAFYKTCPSGLHWDPVNLICNFAEAVDTATCKDCVANPNVCLKPDDCDGDYCEITCDLDAGYYCDKQNPDSYCMCVGDQVTPGGQDCIDDSVSCLARKYNYKSFWMRCPSGLHWDPEVKQCNIKENIKTSC